MLSIKIAQILKLTPLRQQIPFIYMGKCIPKSSYFHTTCCYCSLHIYVYIVFFFFWCTHLFKHRHVQRQAVCRCFVWFCLVYSDTGSDWDSVLDLGSRVSGLGVRLRLQCLALQTSSLTTASTGVDRVLSIIIIRQLKYDRIITRHSCVFL